MALHRRLKTLFAQQLLQPAGTLQSASTEKECADGIYVLQSARLKVQTSGKTKKSDFPPVFEDCVVL